MGPGTRLLLEAHGFPRGRYQVTRRLLWKLRDSIRGVVQPVAGRRQ